MALASLFAFPLFNVIFFVTAALIIVFPWMKSSFHFFFLLVMRKTSQQLEYAADFYFSDTLCVGHRIFSNTVFYDESKARPEGGADALSTQCFSQSVSTKAATAGGFSQFQGGETISPSFSPFSSSSPFSLKYLS